MKYSELSRNSVLALTVWDLYGTHKPVAVGGTTVSLFGKHGWVLLRGTMTILLCLSIIYHSKYMVNIFILLCSLLYREVSTTNYECIVVKVGPKETILCLIAS